MSWGIRITILYGAFMAMILFLVFRTMNEKVDLVSADYYQNELKYQDQIDRQNESSTLAVQPEIQVSGKNVSIKFPESIAPGNISGTLKFYRPSDSSKDFSTALQVDDSGTQLVSTEKFSKGIYQAQLTWSAEGKNYYNEISLYIP
jgi:hypothetical protein